MSEHLDTMINATIEQKPGEFATSFDAEMAERTAAALEARKQELAQGYLEDEEAEATDAEIAAMLEPAPEGEIPAVETAPDKKE